MNKPSVLTPKIVSAANDNLRAEINILKKVK